MTDITELAQREKFEAWFKSSFHPDKTGPYIKDQLYFAWKAAGAELVEALEKSQQPAVQVSDMSRICAESYQVVGALAEALNIFDDPCVIKALDNLSAQELVHEDVLPFSVDESAQPAPGKWIPVSERMPDDDDFVYIWPRPDFGVELHVGQYCERSHKGGGWYAQVYEQNYGIEWHPITVTHWMPLPAAPQEVK